MGGVENKTWGTILVSSSLAGRPNGREAGGGFTKVGSPECCFRLLRISESWSPQKPADDSRGPRNWTHRLVQLPSAGGLRCDRRSGPGRGRPRPVSRGEKQAGMDSVKGQVSFFLT